MSYFSVQDLTAKICIPMLTKIKVAKSRNSSQLIVNVAII